MSYVQIGWDMNQHFSKEIFAIAILAPRALWLRDSNVIFGNGEVVSLLKFYLCVDKQDALSNFKNENSLKYFN